MEFCKIKLQMVQQTTFKTSDDTIRSSKDIVNFIRNVEELDKASEEIAILICLNTKNKVIYFSEIAKGGIDYCNLDIKNIFKTILTCNSNRFILIHTHPSGSTKASQHDILMTKRIKEASKLLSIDFLDHIIVANDDYASCMVCD